MKAYPLLDTLILSNQSVSARTYASLHAGVTRYRLFAPLHPAEAGQDGVNCVRTFLSDFTSE
jgi:hypothetical protein